MSKKIFMDAFFTQFHEFMTQLMTVFPDDHDFAVYDAGVSLLKNVNPGLVIVEFNKHVLPFEDILRSKNSDFFLKHTFDSLEPDNTMEQVINKLKGYWVSLSEANKESIWRYIILLLDIVKRCN
jgi:hypothetical protein